MKIQIQKLSAGYGDKAVFQDLSMELSEAGHYVLMGPSGCGKTTFLKVLAGLHIPSEGMIQGMEEKRVSMVFQEDRLCESFSALDNVLMVCGGKRKQERAKEALIGVGLTERMKKPVRELSGGMRRRVALARALAVPFDLLLLDEPLKGLDGEAKKQLLSFLKERTIGKTVLMVTHEIEETEVFGAEIILWKSDAF